MYKKCKRDYLFRRNICRINKCKKEAADLYFRDWNMSVMQMKSPFQLPFKLHTIQIYLSWNSYLLIAEKVFDIFFMNLASPVLRQLIATQPCINYCTSVWCPIKKESWKKEDAFILQNKPGNKGLKKNFFPFFHNTAKDNRTIRKKKVKKHLLKRHFFLV